MDMSTWRAKHGRAWSELEVREVLALARWKRAHGSRWKRFLRHSWETCDWPSSCTDVATLQGLRNRLGPAWLARIVWPPKA
jgi:hypothetical protein